MTATPDDNIAVAIAVLSHDLRSPLQTISAAIAHLSGALNDGEIVSCHEDLRLIQGATVVMQQMIHDLLDVGMAMRGRLSIAKFPQRVDRLLVEATEALRSAAQGKNIELQLLCDPGLPDVRADGQRLLQALTNLGEHAIRITPPRGRVSLRATRGSDVVVFEISYTGPGIPATDMAGIFELIGRDAHSPGINMGLGLAIAKAVVEAHGGRISVTSAPRIGTTFHFGIPIERSGIADLLGRPDSRPVRETTRAE